MKYQRSGLNYIIKQDGSKRLQSEGTVPLFDTQKIPARPENSLIFT